MTDNKYEYQAVVERVVDGDTLDLAVQIWTWKIPFPLDLGRIFGLPEESASLLDLGFKIWVCAGFDRGGLVLTLVLHERFRVLGVDTPEVYGVKREDRGPGEAASAFVEGLLPIGAEVTIDTRKGQGKYGRWLADIWPARRWPDDERIVSVTRAGGLQSLTERIIAAGHGVAYDGGSR